MDQLGPNEAALAERHLTQHYVGFVQCDILPCSAITVIVFVTRVPLAVPAIVKLSRRELYRVIEEEMGIPFSTFRLIDLDYSRHSYCTAAFRNLYIRLERSC